MDMNEILNAWDNFQKKEKNRKKEESRVQISHKKANAPTKEEKALAEENNLDFLIEKENSKKINPMELYLRRYGVVDKDKIQEREEEKNRFNNREYLINMKPEAAIDLHGLHADETEQRLNAFVNECLHKNLKKILIIHGKGIHSQGCDPVLAKIVKSFIEKNKHCGLSGHPKNKSEGGTGATWVILK